MQPFSLYLPTRLIYGKDRIEELDDLTRNYGTRVLLVAGTGSARKSGLVDRVKAALVGREIIELEGVVPNPRIDSVRAGAALCKEHGVDFIVAVGGGSVIDCSKAIAAAAVSDEEAWELVRHPDRIEKALPLFTVLTLAATGSEYDNSAVISNTATSEKLGMANDLLAPVASICDPSLTFSVPAYHTAAGIADIMSHTFEQYMVMEGNPVSDGFCETILRTCIEYGPKAVKDPENEEARSALMLASSFGCNGMLALGRTPSPWPCHGIEHEISAFHDITHGVGLAIITPHWMRYSLTETTLPRFVQYGVRVWGLDPEGDPMTVAQTAIDKTAEFFASIGIPSRLSETGVTDEHFEAMAEHVETCWWSLQGALRPIDRAGVLEILRASL